MARLSGAIATVFLGWRTAHGLAFPPPGRRRHGEFANSVLPRDHHCRRWSLPGAKFEGTDPSVISGNREYLRRALGFSEDQLDNISTKVGGGNILTLQPGVLEERVRWLTSRLDLKKREMKKMAQKQPEILGCRPEESVAPKREHGQSRPLSDDTSSRNKSPTPPTVSGYSAEDTRLSPKIEYLQTRLLLDDESLRKMILAAPSVLGFSTEHNVAPKLDWLQRRLDLDPGALGKMMRKYPMLFGHGVETNIEPTLEWLQQRLDLKDAAVRKMVRRNPTILGMSHDAMEPKLMWLQRRLDLNEASVSEMIQKMPSLLGFNVDANLKPTLDFYIDALGDEEEALRLVVPDPSLFTYSLKNRLTPRLEEAQDAGMTIDSACLRRIAKYTNDRWNTEMGN